MSIDMPRLVIYFLASLIITVFGYLLVPVIYCIKKSKLSQKQIKRICIINGIVVWFIFQIIAISLYDDASSGGAVFLWSAVAYHLLKKHCLNDERPKVQSMVICSYCGQLCEVHRCTCPHCGKSLDPSENNSPNQTNYPSTPSATAFPFDTHSYSSVQQHSRNHCTRCGKQTIPNSNFCRRCGAPVNQETRSFEE